MDKSEFQGELDAVIAGTRREFWSPDNLRIYGDEPAATVNTCGASGGSNKAHTNDLGPVSHGKTKPPPALISNGADNVGEHLHVMKISEETCSSSSSSLRGRREDGTPLTELDLLVQKYDRRLKRFRPAENQTNTKKLKCSTKDTPGKYKCDACGRGFKRKDHLHRHVLIHGEERNYSCDVCDKSFKQPNGLSSHMKVHDSNHCYDCQRCDYSSKWKTHFNEHVRLHSVESEFKCERCPKAYKRKEVLRQHRLKHTFEVQFRCEKCDCGFKTKSRLNRHRKVHEDIREFKCAVCSKAFKSSSNLRGHSAIHSNDKLFPCDKCSKAFHQKSDLNKHSRIHTGEKPFVCWDCTKAFTHSSGLRYHRLKCPKLDFRVKDDPEEEDYSTPKGNLIETFASTIYSDNEEGNSGFNTMYTECAADVLSGLVDNLDGTLTGRVIQATRS